MPFVAPLHAHHDIIGQSNGRAHPHLHSVQV